MAEAWAPKDNLADYLDTVLDRAKRRKGLRENSDVVEALKNPSVTLATIRTGMEAIVQDLGEHGRDKPQALTLDALDRHRPGHPDELLQYRFLCRGGGLLFVGPTGIGKSSFTLQCAINWSIGKPAFDIRPAGTLRIVIVQAENDQGDMAEIVDGVFRGLGLTQDEQCRASAAVRIVHSNEQTGQQFCSDVLRPVLQEHNPDLIFIDPILAFLGGDANSAKDVGGFLRNQLQPLLKMFNCGVVVIHHTNKPTSGKDKADWQAGDNAYLGSGSAEFANWARAVLIIQNIGSHEVFQLRAGKRGQRLGWLEADGTTKAYTKLIAHSKEPGAICWREADESEAPAATVIKGKKTWTAEDVLAHVPADRPIDKRGLLSKLEAAQMTQRRAKGLLEEMISAGIVHEWRIKRTGSRPMLQIARQPQPEAFVV